MKGTSKVFRTQNAAMYATKIYILSYSSKVQQKYLCLVKESGRCGSCFYLLKDIRWAESHLEIELQNLKYNRHI